MLPPHSFKQKHNIAGVALVNASPERAAHDLCQMAKAASFSGGSAVHLVNAYTISLAAKDLRYKGLLNSASGNFPDGKPLTWWKQKGGLKLQQIRGPKLFEDVMNFGRNVNVRHYLLGSTPETLLLLEQELRKRYPGVEIVGSFSPPFRKLSQDEINSQDDAILKSGAELVWVGLGTPKQDWEAQRLAAKLPVVSVAVGAAFDFSAGTKKAAPELMARLGLEWLFRLLSEPRRLWKRYLVGNVLFLWAVLRYRVQK